VIDRQLSAKSTLRFAYDYGYGDFDDTTTEKETENLLSAKWIRVIR